jgi:hypothetical protein
MVRASLPRAADRPITRFQGNESPYVLRLSRCVSRWWAARARPALLGCGIADRYIDGKRTEQRGDMNIP